MSYIRLTLFTLLLLTPLNALAAARIAGTGCYGPGDEIIVRGDAFGAVQSGSIELHARQATIILNVASWSDTRLRLRLPRRNIPIGDNLRVIWNEVTGPDQLLGRIDVCQSGRTTRDRALADEVAAPDGTAEYVVATPDSRRDAIIDRMSRLGAVVLRQRSLPRFGETLIFLSLPEALDVGDARRAIQEIDPAAEIDLHHIYGYAAGPRLYASEMIGDDPGNTCSLSQEIRVGIIDGPVNARHPALVDAALTRHVAISSSERSPNANHGTAVTALIAGSPEAGPLAGFSPGVEIFAAEAFGVVRGQPVARLESIAASLDWMVSQDVALINMSMSGADNRVFERLLRRTADFGPVIVAATGNDASDEAQLPSASSATIAVTAVDAAGRLYRQANRGAHVDFAAPGVDLWVAYGVDGRYQSGTSFAAPIATAVLARALAAGAMTTQDARRYLSERALDLGAAGKDREFGFGLIQTDGCQ